MGSVNQSRSLTPPAELGKAERTGIAILGVGLLASLVALVGDNRSPLLPMLIGLAFLITGGILLDRKGRQYKTTAAILGLAGLLSLAFLLIDISVNHIVWTVLTIGFSSVGALIYLVSHYKKRPAGINNDGLTHSETTRKSGVKAWFLAIVFTGFYILLYWFPAQLHGLIVATDPLAEALTGHSALVYNNDGSFSHYNQWFLYGLIYSLAVLIMGIRFIIKYRHNRYQIIRTISVTFFQLVIAFLLPSILESLNERTHYFHYFWPLDHDALFPGTISSLTAGGLWGKFILYWSIIMAFIATPVLTFFFGKRWYCSWVCGCGGLAETAGDPWRHLSDKSLKAWQIERVLIHGVLVVITGVTVLLLADWQWQFLGEGIASGFKKGYGFLIASTFAGVIGVGFYPIMGSRVWCRFGCPQAAILGILQKWFSRFRITTNGGQCISCGNCSTYCEMGIDVKWYAQRGQNIVRASCVGCGICSAVCPRGVLKLESGPAKGKTAIHIDRDEVKVIHN